MHTGKKKKIQLLISKVTLALKLYNPYSFITKKQRVCRTELNLVVQERSWSPEFTTYPKHPSPPVSELPVYEMEQDCLSFVPAARRED